MVQTKREVDRTEFAVAECQGIENHCTSVWGVFQLAMACKMVQRESSKVSEVEVDAFDALRFRQELIISAMAWITLVTAFGVASVIVAPIEPVNDLDPGEITGGLV